MYRSEKSKFIETRLRKFAGDYDVVHDNYIEVFRTYFQQQDSKLNKQRFLDEIRDLKGGENSDLNCTPYEIIGLVSDWNLRIDSYALCTLLLRKSLSLTKIKGSVLNDYLLPSLQSKIQVEEKSVEEEKFSSLTEVSKIDLEKAYEEMLDEEK